MNRKGNTALVAILAVVLLAIVIGGVWYYTNSSGSSSANQQGVLNTQTPMSQVVIQSIDPSTVYADKNGVWNGTEVVTISGTGFTPTNNTVTLQGPLNNSSSLGYEIYNATSSDGRTITFMSDDTNALSSNCGVGNGLCSVNASLIVGKYNVFVNNADGTSSMETFTIEQ